MTFIAFVIRKTIDWHAFPTDDKTYAVAKNLGRMRDSSSSFPDEGTSLSSTRPVGFSKDWAGVHSGGCPSENACALDKYPEPFPAGLGSSLNIAKEESHGQLHFFIRSVSLALRFPLLLPVNHIQAQT